MHSIDFCVFSTTAKEVLIHRNFIFQARRISVPNQSKQIFLPAVAIDSYLKKLQQCHFNVHDKSLQRGNSLLPLKLFYYKFINKF